MFDYPDVPNLPGVPALLRVPQSAFNLVSTGLDEATGIMRTVSSLARSNPLAALSSIAGDLVDTTDLMGSVTDTITNYASSVMGRFLSPVASINAGLASITSAITSGPSDPISSISSDIFGTTEELAFTSADFDASVIDEPSLDGIETVTVTAVKLDAQWGVFKDGKSVIKADSVGEFGITKEWTISNYPIEEGNFQSFNKVYVPFDARVRFQTGGSLANRAAMLESIEAIAGDLLQYDVAMPEQIFQSVNVVHYDLQRRNDNGLGILIVDVYLEEVRATATAEFSSAAAEPTAPNPAPAPKSPTAAPQKKTGAKQAKPPSSVQIQKINDANSMLFGLL